MRAIATLAQKLKYVEMQKAYYSACIKGENLTDIEWSIAADNYAKYSADVIRYTAGIKRLTDRLHFEDNV
jgi:hypothetical protein